MATPTIYQIMRTIRRSAGPFMVVVGGLVGLGLLTFSYIYSQLPSCETYRALAERPMAPVLLDRHEEPLQPEMGGAVYLHGEAAAIELLDSLSAGPYLDPSMLPPGLVEDLKLIEGWDAWKGFHFDGVLRSLLGRGSRTIQQQLAGLLHQTSGSQRSKWRRATEIITAFKLCRCFSADDQLALYLTQVPFSTETRPGLYAASYGLYGIAPQKLRRPQWTALYALLPSPRRSLDPARQEWFESAYRRRLDLLLGAGHITAEERSGWNTPPPFQRPPRPDGWACGTAVARVLEEARLLLREPGWSLTDGLEITTTLDCRLAARLAPHVEAERRYQRGRDIHVSLLVLDEAGEILVYTQDGQSRPTDLDRLNYADEGPGSRGKLIGILLYVDELLRQGHTPEEILATPLPTIYRLPGGHVVRPHHATGASVSLREAVAYSENPPFYFIAERLTPERITAALAPYGIAHEPVLSVLMGAQGASELQLVGLYASLLQHDGRPIRPRFIRRIVDRQTGIVLYDGRQAPQTAPALSVRPEAYAITRELLRGVVAAGTAAKVRLPQACAAPDIVVKTGSSQGKYDWRGVTGVVGPYTVSVLVEGWGVPSSPASAVPAFDRLLEKLLCPDS